MLFRLKFNSTNVCVCVFVTLTQYVLSECVVDTNINLLENSTNLDTSINLTSLSIAEHMIIG